VSEEHIVDIIRHTLFTALQVSAPMLIIAMIVGFGISVFQSVTQINEMTLTFVPKILIFALTLSVAFPWILKTVVKFTLNIFTNHWERVVNLTTYAQ